MARARKPKANPWRDVVADVQSGELMPLYLLGGQESFLSRRAYDLLYPAAIGSGPRGFNEQTFLGDKTSGAAIAGACNTLPMMGKRRVVVVRQIERMKKEHQDQLAEYCANPSPTTVLILMMSDDPSKKIDGRTKLPKAIKKNGRYCEFKRMYGRDLQGWIGEEARRLEKKLEPMCAGYLEGLMGNDLSQIANALGIAALYVGEEDRILLSDLEEVVAGRKQDALWDMLDAIGERRFPRAVRAMQQLSRQGEEPHSMLRLISKRLRELRRARVGLDEGMSPRDAAIAAGIPGAIAWKFDGQIRAWRPPQLRWAIARMVQAESDMKGGLRVDPRMALESAVLDVLR
ncbi:MAG: DNA polymerase III subunit delta [Deltaproteobacteria bacterium]|nr:DNA polymerase III subunit delta [Deltaproteobacteria bacterium]